MSNYRLSLEYCVPWNYLDRAVGAMNDVLSHYQHVVDSFELIHGTKGAYEFKVNDKLVYSKKDLGRHAEPGEILNLFKEIVGPDVVVYPQTK